MDCQGDHLYWYNERATLSTLAGAVYSLRSEKKPHYVLEEYRSTKGRGKGRWEGRIDMWLRLGKTDYILEAKQKWVSITNKLKIENIAHSIEATLVDAKTEAEESTEGSDGYHPKSIGMIFVVPYFKGNSRETLKKRCEDLKAIFAEIDCFSYAYAFPTNGMITENASGYLYPGVILLMK